MRRAPLSAAHADVEEKAVCHARSRHRVVALSLLRQESALARVDHPN
jgi:hypothetical protein